MSAPRLEDLGTWTDKLPSLPEVVHYLMRSLSDERADIDTLAHHINSDPVIVARLLSAANSVGSGLSTRIHSARQAFLVLGANRVVSIVLASALSHRFDHQGSGFDTRILWRHSLGVAACAQVVADAYRRAFRAAGDGIAHAATALPEDDLWEYMCQHGRALRTHRARLAALRAATHP